jgi:K+-transporting ATPase KdpF subunit
VELYQGVGTPLGGPMEYVIAGIVAAFLFVYLMYALLRPEKF